MSEQFLYTKKNLILLASVLMCFTAFCIETDIYAPSFPNMVDYFATTESRIQDILTWNFIGLCLSGLFYGPLSDAFGRKRLLCFGLVLFAFSSITCTFVSSVEQLIVCRFLQGLGCGAITGICTAMVFDVFPSQKSAQLISVLNSFVTGMMAFAPLLGNWVNIQFGWRMNFVIIAALSVLSLVFTLFLVSETHDVKKRCAFSVGQILKDYKSLLFSYSFMSNTLLWTTMFGLLIVFTSNLSLIYIDYLHVEQSLFGYYQSAIMTAFFVASLVAAKLIGKFGMSATKRIGNSLFVTGVFCLAGFSQYSPPSALALTIAMSLASMGVAISGVIYFVDSMAEFPEAKGSTTAFSQSLRLLVSATLVGLAAVSFDGSIKPIAYMALGIVILMTVLSLGLVMRKSRIAAAA